MPSVSTSGNVAVQLLRNGGLSEAASQSNNLTGSANRSPLPDDSILDPAATAARSKIADALFNVTSVGQTQAKVALFDKVGEALGVRSAEFASDAEYKAAVRTAFSSIKLQPGGDQAIAAIEKQLGLDKLGISLSIVMDAMTMLSADAHQALSAALQEAEHSSLQRSKTIGDFVNVQKDELGLYKLV